MLEAAIICLALNVYHEGRSEPIEGQFAIAQVTLNRAGRKPDKVCDVVQASKQFSWTISPPPVTDTAAFRNAVSVARLALNMADFTGGATHYHTLAITPYWRTDMTVQGQWGNHIFYKRKKPL